MTDNEKILVIVKIAGFVQANPRPINDNKPPERPKALLRDLLNLF